MEAILQGFQLFQAGGPVMYLLLACSLFVGYIGIERAIFYGDMDAGKAFAEQFYTQMKLRRYDQAQRLAMDARGGLPLILQDVFQHQAGPDVKAFVEMQSGIFVAKLRRRLYYLSVIVTMAPLLGILGTVTGIIRSFHILGGGEAPDPTAVISGLAEALGTTAAGLIIAMATLVPYNALISRVQREARRLEQVGGRAVVAYKRGLAHAADNRV